MKKWQPWLAAGICMAVGIGMMLFGVFRGEADTVWKKAVIICLECIGIG